MCELIASGSFRVTESRRHSLATAKLSFTISDNTVEMTVEGMTLVESLKTWKFNRFPVVFQTFQTSYTQIY